MDRDSPASNPLRWADPFGLAALSAFAYAFAFVCARRGLFPLDQSHIFDGAYRIVRGEIPYKDFLLTYPPATYILQAGFFKLLGVHYFAYCAAAAAINAACALLSVFLLRTLFPGRRVLSYLAGFLSAVWLMPPFGTLNVDRAGGFFFLASFYAMLYARFSFKDRLGTRRILIAASGLGAFLIFLSKQNLGLLAAPLLMSALIAANGSDFKSTLKDGAAMIAGWSAGAAVFWLWLRGFSDVDNFVRYSIRIPMELGAERLTYKGWPGVWDALSLGWAQAWRRGATYLPSMSGDVPAGIRWLLSGLALGASASLIFASSTDRRRTAAISALGLVLLQSLFIATTNNVYANGLMFLGPTLALVAGLCFEPLAERKVAKTLCAGAFAGLAVVLAVFGARLSLRKEIRSVLFEGSRFDRPMPFRNLEPLQWGEPTRMADHGESGARAASEDVREADVLGILQWLREKNRNFFIFPDFTIFYGIVGAPPPIPLLHFTKGKTYSRNYDARLDRWIVEGLKKNDVAVFVLERVSFRGTQSRLDDFPLLKTYFKENFSMTGEVGIFEIYQRK